VTAPLESGAGAGAAGLIATGPLSVIIFPALGLTLLRREQRAPGQAESAPPPIPAPAMPVSTLEDHASCQAAPMSAR
jgi:hypothetical protein